MTNDCHILKLIILLENLLLKVFQPLCNELSEEVIRLWRNYSLKLHSSE